MKQIYYAIQSILHGRGSNVTKVISLSLGLTIGILLFSQIAFELNYEKCYPEADRLVLVRGGGENVKTGEKGEGYDDSLCCRELLLINYVTVHSVLSNVAKIHSRLPAAMEFWLVCLGILAYSCQNTSRDSDM